jgi:integrase
LITAAAGDTPLEQRDRAMVELLYASGLRVSEWCGARLENLDLEKGFIRVVGKGNKQRLVPVGSGAREALERYLRTGRPELVSRRTGGPMARGLDAAPVGREALRPRIGKVGNVGRIIRPCRDAVGAVVAANGQFAIGANVERHNGAVRENTFGMIPGRIGDGTAVLFRRFHCLFVEPGTLL